MTSLRFGSPFVLAMAVALLLLTCGFRSPRPAVALGGDPSCICHYTKDPAGTPLSTVSPGCTPSGGVYLSTQLTYYTTEDGQCHLANCEDAARPCVATGSIEAWTNSPCRLGIKTGGSFVALAYLYVAHEFDENLDCGESAIYLICIGSVPIHQHENVCGQCPW